MLKYLIIQLSPTSVSFCQNDRNTHPGDLMSIDTLKKAVLFSMQENLNVQFTFPDEKLPQAYHDLIDTIDHVSIVSSTCEDTTLKNHADIIVFDSWNGIESYPFQTDKSYVLRTDRKQLFSHAGSLGAILKQVNSLSIIITDIHSFKSEDFVTYQKILEGLVPVLAAQIKTGRDIHFNLLTNRILLDKMNNCGAGDQTLTLAPDGNFYICPAFYADKTPEGTAGNINCGPDIKNPQLYKLSHAPICRTCDAFQCPRCVWLNKQTTYEVNTPSHEQCVLSHIERNASGKLLQELKKLPGFNFKTQIPETDCLDPFDKIWFGNQNHKTQLT